MIPKKEESQKQTINCSTIIEIENDDDEDNFVEMVCDLDLNIYGVESNVESIMSEI